MVVEARCDGDVRLVGEITGGPAALDKLTARFGRDGRSLRAA
jgi:hypothetical protein